jgi:spore maturation protein CgeB
MALSPADAARPAARPLPLSVVLLAVYHAQGQPHRGVSYEVTNFLPTLRSLCERVSFFDFYTAFLERGRERMNEEALALVRRERPDLVIVPLFKEEFLPEVVEEMGSLATTVAYFFDDNWRREYAERWAPRFSYFTTPHTWTERIWRERGLANVIYSPFGFDHRTYVRREVPKDIDVSFVGGFHPWRAWVLKRLRRAGIRVAVWGNAWPNGVLSTRGMVDVFNRSKVNLNLSDSVSWDLRYLVSSHRAVRNLLVSRKRGEQLKGRHFEITGCGGFQLTFYTEDLERHFEISREIAVYHDEEDLVEKVGYFLRNDAEREAVAEAGWRRALRDHTYERRFRELIEEIDRRGWRPPLAGAARPRSAP